MPLTDPDGHKTTKPKKTQYDKCRKNLNKKGFEKCVFGTKKTTQQCEKDAVHKVCEEYRHNGNRCDGADSVHEKCRAGGT
ncbi:hypothetical protein [Nonomuraea sp. NPDC001699]